MLPVTRQGAGCAAGGGARARNRLQPPRADAARARDPAPLPRCVPARGSARYLIITRAAVSGDAASEAADADRAKQRAARRAARRRSSESAEPGSSSGSDAEEQQQQQQHPEQPSTSGRELGPAPAPSSTPARGSRVAARRQLRARAARRVPAALVPDEQVGEDEDEAEPTASGLAVDEEWDFFPGSEPGDEAPEPHAAGEARAGQPASSSAAADAGGEGESDAPQPVQLPQSVLESARQQPRPPPPRQPLPGEPQQQQAQQQQRTYAEAVRLPESSPMYLPVLTDEDLDSDPPGHRSGYVAVIGRPNAGKSTLINTIVGQKLSIVTYKPQTTRHRVVGIASGPDHQMILFDTPGIMQEQRSKLDERMMAAVVSSIKAAEVIVAVVDAADRPQEALAMFQPGPDWSGPPMAVLLNKADLLAPEQLAALQEWYRTNCRAEQVFAGSALPGADGGDAGVAAVKAWAVSKLPEGPTLYPKSMISQQPERFFVSEIIRQHIFTQYDQEIPYSCQVQIAEFKERRGVKDYIKAVILVERESQAPIVLGRGGAAIRALGSAARAEVEEFLERPVFLELSVQVAPAWRQQADRLKDFGYFDPLFIT